MTGKALFKGYAPHSYDTTFAFDNRPSEMSVLADHPEEMSKTDDSYIAWSNELAKKAIFSLHAK